VNEAALAVDAGQTEIRAVLVDDERGPRMATAPGVLQMGGSVGPEEVAAGLMAAVTGLGPLPGPPLPTGVGLSGLESIDNGDLDRLAQLLRRDLRAARLAIASDALTALLGALGARDGVVVAAGTGTACLGRRGERLAKVDGWGALLGDAGSGFAIGRAGLDAALRQFDGRGGSKSLMGAAKRHFGTIERLPARINAAAVPTRAIAAFAVDVASEAAAGDERAVGVLRDAAVELATTASAALRRLYEPDEPAVVSYTGNVFRAGELIVDPFTRELTSQRPNTTVVPPAGDPLAGARLLARGSLNLRPEPGILSTWT
jgi:glucosamine kinase